METPTSWRHQILTADRVLTMIHSYVKWWLKQDGRKSEKYTLKIEPKEIDFIIEEVDRRVYWADEFDDWIHYCNWDKWRECETYANSYFECLKNTVEDRVIEGETGVFIAVDGYDESDESDGSDESDD